VLTIVSTGLTDGSKSMIIIAGIERPFGCVGADFMANGNEHANLNGRYLEREGKSPQRPV